MASPYSKDQKGRGGGRDEKTLKGRGKEKALSTTQDGTLSLSAGAARVPGRATS